MPSCGQGRPSLAPPFCARVAQWIEQRFPKPLVVGSTPAPGATFKHKTRFCCCHLLLFVATSNSSLQQQNNSKFSGGGQAGCHLPGWRASGGRPVIAAESVAGAGLDMASQDGPGRVCGHLPSRAGVGRGGGRRRPVRRFCGLAGAAAVGGADIETGGAAWRRRKPARTDQRTSSSKISCSPVSASLAVPSQSKYMPTCWPSFLMIRGL